jgi:hypothetical protein
MAGSADEYRLKAADMLAKAEQHELFRAEFENLAKAFLRLADQADRNAQLGWPMGRMIVPPIRSSSLRKRSRNSSNKCSPKMKARVTELAGKYLGRAA